MSVLLCPLRPVCLAPLPVGTCHKPVASCPGWAVQLVAVSSQYAEIVGSIPGPSERMQEAINECVNKRNSGLMFLSFPPSL